MKAKKPKVAAKKMTFGGVASGGKNRVGPATADARLEQIVIPAPPQPAPTLPNEIDQTRFVESTWTRYTRHRYAMKKDELDRMHASMKQACLALELADPILFRKAMEKTVGAYFPLERRVLVDTPPTDGWASIDRNDKVTP
jgi:hypothetical protein